MIVWATWSIFPTQVGRTTKTDSKTGLGIKIMCWMFLNFPLQYWPARGFPLRPGKLRQGGQEDPWAWWWPPGWLWVCLFWGQKKKKKKEGQNTVRGPAAAPLQLWAGLQVGVGYILLILCLQKSTISSSSVDHQAGLVFTSPPICRTIHHTIAQPHMPRSHQTFRPVLAVKLMGIMFKNRWWATGFHTITAEDADEWCQKWPVWSTPQLNHGVLWAMIEVFEYRRVRIVCPFCELGVCKKKTLPHWTFFFPCYNSCARQEAWARSLGCPMSLGPLIMEVDGLLW